MLKIAFILTLTVFSSTLIADEACFIDNSNYNIEVSSYNQTNDWQHTPIILKKNSGDQNQCISLNASDTYNINLSIGEKLNRADNLPINITDPLVGPAHWSWNKTKNTLSGPTDVQKISVSDMDKVCSTDKYNICRLVIDNSKAQHGPSHSHMAPPAACIMSPSGSMIC